MGGDPSAKNDTVVNAGKLKKQIKELSRETAVGTPLTGRKRLKIERDENYKQVSKQVAKWLPQIKLNRETDFVDFTTADAVGESVKLNSLG